MYCIKCGVSLANTEKQCPLCGTAVFHPELSQPEAEPLYPRDSMPAPKRHPWGALMILTAIFLLTASICMYCDWQLGHVIQWSGYVVGALTVLYVIAVLPCWFRNPNPVIFLPCDFVAIGLYLLYINLATGGGWFLSFAFPVTGALGLIFCAVVTLLRYCPKGGLFILGGASLALGGFTLLLEYLLHITFGLPGLGTWSPYPLFVFTLTGLCLLLIAICPPLRESLERKFFL